jgi:hypothetical protein
MCPIREKCGRTFGVMLSSNPARTRTYTRTRNPNPTPNPIKA